MSSRRFFGMSMIFLGLGNSISVLTAKFAEEQKSSIDIQTRLKRRVSVIAAYLT